MSVGEQNEGGDGVTVVFLAGVSGEPETYR